MGYTKGPWSIDKHSPMRINADWDGGPWQIAQAIGWAGDRYEEPKANAILIAAAPELLAACEAVLASDNSRWLSIHVKGKVELAIAKAKGEHHAAGSQGEAA